MSTYYNLAIQRHPDSVENMKKEIWVDFYHKFLLISNINTAIDICKGQKEPYEHKPPKKMMIQAMIKSVYESLTEDDLLKRSLGRNTQNNNQLNKKCLRKLKAYFMKSPINNK